MAIDLTNSQLLEIRLAVEELNASFAYHLDHGEIDALVDLFSVDARYTHGERRSEGRDEIEGARRERLGSPFSPVAGLFLRGSTR